MQRIKLFWQQSFRSDPLAFWLEMISFVFTVGASAALAITAQNPNMAQIYPAFFVGAVTQCWASYRRGAAWIMMVTGYFAILNVFGFGRSLSWW
jgi:hypothetical protein